LTQQDHWFHPCLRHQHPVERILVNRRQLYDFDRMLPDDGQMIESGRLNARQHFRRFRLQLAERALDTDFPERRGACEYFARLDPLPRLF
jgi:hypothetical protein